MKAEWNPVRVLKSFSLYILYKTLTGLCEGWLNKVLIVQVSDTTMLIRITTVCPKKLIVFFKKYTG
jgi:hypothetical protein